MGLLAALGAAPFLVSAAVRRGNTTGIVGASVFAATTVLLYLASTLYHALPPHRAKRVFRILDHGAVFLLIAGTYTPFTLRVLRGMWGWTLLALVWGLAALGIVLTAARGIRHPRLATGVYLGMGWLIVIATKRMRYSHFIWHLLVLAGSTCHFVAVLWYAA